MAGKERTEVARTVTKNIRELLVGYRSLMEDACRAEALTLPQLRLLKAVAEHNGDSAAALARFCQVTPQTLQAMLARAVREGWIVRGHSDRSQRILTARLTPKGRAALRRGMTMAEGIEERLWHGISLSTLRTFNEILSSGLINLHEELSRKSRQPTTHS